MRPIKILTQGTDIQTNRYKTVRWCDPAWWPLIVYDWALTFEQEFELVWKKRWSFITVLCVCVRYIGLLYSVINVLWSIPVSFTNTDCLILDLISTWIPVVVNAMLGVIVIIRIHVMYGRSKKILIFLVIVLLASTVAACIMSVIAKIGISAQEFILSGYHMCRWSPHDPDQVELDYEILVSTVIWEIPAFVLAVWVVIKHFRERRQFPTRSTIGGFFTVLIQSHAFYFVAFAIVACLRLGLLSTYIIFSSYVGNTYYFGILQIVQELQMFVLGPRLILSIREYHSKLLASSDSEQA